MSDLLGNIGWEFIFGEEPEKIPNPNLPENIPHIKAKIKSKVDALKPLMDNRGKPVYDEFRLKIRTELFDLLTNESECGCKACKSISNIRYIFDLMVNIQRKIKEE